jgi:hypothetical protein
MDGSRRSLSRNANVRLLVRRWADGRAAQRSVGFLSFSAVDALATDALIENFEEYLSE